MISKVPGLALIGPFCITCPSLSQSLRLGGLEYADWTSPGRMATPRAGGGQVMTEKEGSAVPGRKPVGAFRGRARQVTEVKGPGAR